jgi:hypothetical protein
VLARLRLPVIACRSVVAPVVSISSLNVPPAF